MMNKRMGFFAAAMVVMGLGLSCVDEDSAAGSVSLYFYDASDKSVKVWDSADIAFDQGVPAKPDRVITGKQLTDTDGLTTGGLAFDDSNNCLYLLFKTGKIVRIDRVRSQDGDLTSSSDVVSFNLDSNALYASKELGQLAVDSGQGDLYIAEKTSDKGKFWYVADAARRANGEKITLAPEDKDSAANTQCTGVAAFNGALYAYFGGGKEIEDNSNPPQKLTGPRLRKGSPSGWDMTNYGKDVFIYSNDTLGDTGSLALDRDNNVLYLCRWKNGSLQDPPILAYETKDFSTGFSFDGYRKLGKASECPGMRFITHAGRQDWLAGAGGNGTIFMWKNAKDGEAFTTLTVSGAQIMGLAFDGNR